jgi:adenylyltransferase/sulfurtransferase
MRFGELRTRRRSDCPVCGANPTIREPKDIQTMPSDSSQGVRRLSAADLNELLHGGAKPLLVDVREDEEFAAGHLPGSLHIPLGELPARLAEIPKGAAPVFICRSGGRSLNACLLALRADIASPANLEGGLRAWAASIDPSLTVI